MKRKKYSFVFAIVLVWLVAGFFNEGKLIDLILAASSIMFFVFLILDFAGNRIEFSVPKIHILVIDILALGTILSGSIVKVDYANYFLYLFVLCTLVFVFTTVRNTEREETK